MQALIIADDDMVVRRLSSDRAEVLIACGDISDETISTAAQRCRPVKIFAVKGNHDAGTDFAAPVIDLHLRREAHDGLTFGGFRGAWRYKPRGHFLYEQDEVRQQLVRFPSVDVFVAHNSPRFVHDREDEVHFGFEAFREYLARMKPRLFIHGHQHVDRESQVGATTVIGVYRARRLEI